LTRYPGVETRIDFLDELSKQTGMRSVFGEMMSLQGRQSGNAVLSVYPIRSSRNQEFRGIKAATDEAAVMAVIDGGVRDIFVSSAHIPQKASSAEVSACLQTIDRAAAEGNSSATIVAASRAQGTSDQSSDPFAPTSGLLSGPQSGAVAPTRILYSDNASLEALSARITDSPFGQIVVVEFGLFRSPTP
jgi:hypothetical protein